MSEFVAMPPKIAAAVVAVMTKVPKLKKAENNSHGNYQFASIDDFLEAVRPLCADAGLIILPNEEASDIQDGWLRVKYSFALIHSSGETWMYRPTRSILISAKMGSQAFGSAQSYVMKNFERALFQIATGDKDQDVDSHPQTELPEEDKGWIERGARLKKQIEEAPTAQDIDRIIAESGTTLAEIKERSAKSYNHLMEIANKRIAAFIQTPKAA